MGRASERTHLSLLYEILGDGIPGLVYPVQGLSAQEQGIFKSLSAGGARTLRKSLKKKKNSQAVPRVKNLLWGKFLAIPWSRRPTLSLAMRRLIGSKQPCCLSSWAGSLTPGVLRRGESRPISQHVSRLTYSCLFSSR